jgi:uncharacterized membrane protein
MTGLIVGLIIGVLVGWYTTKPAVLDKILKRKE